MNGLAPQSSVLHYDTLSTAEKCKHTEALYTKQSLFQKLFDADALEIDTHSQTLALEAGVIRLLEQHGIDARELSTLHTRLSEKQKTYGLDDGVNAVSTLLYAQDEAFANVYVDFLRACVKPLFPFAFYMQKTPTLRIHCPSSINAHHYPRYHSDIGYGHPPSSINLWLPLTAAVPPQHHGFRRMSIADSAMQLAQRGYDFSSFIALACGDSAFNQALHTMSPQVATPKGKLLLFDARCLHTGEPLQRHTRVSMDIRILPVEDFQTSPYIYRGSGRRKIVFMPGEAYFPFSSEAL